MAYGLPNHHPLSKLAQELTDIHDHEAGGVRGREEGLLLHLLRERFGSTSGGGGGGGRANHSTPLSVAAQDLWDVIAARLILETRAARPEWGVAPAVLGRVRALVTTVAGDEAEERRVEKLLAGWRYQIRELLEPSKRIPLKDAVCPACGAREVYTDGVDGRTVSPALVAWPSYDVITCSACAEEWGGNPQNVAAATDFAEPVPV